VSKTASAPAWVGVLDAAESWGVPPWEIVTGSKMLWLHRYYTLRKLRANPDG